MASTDAFRLASKKKLGHQDKEYPPLTVPFEWEADDGTVTTRELVAHYPGDQTVTALIGSIEQDDASEVAGMIFTMLKRAFSDDDYRFIRNKYSTEEIDQDMLQVLLETLMETWTTFPTQPSSDSPQSPPKTGTRSTGRARGPGSAS